MARIPQNLPAGLQMFSPHMEIYLRNGKYVIRSRRNKSKQPATDKQLANRLKMKIVNNFLARFLPCIIVGFANPLIGRKSGYNAGISYHLKNAITGVYPDLAIDYSKVKLSKGSIDVKSIEAFVNGGVDCLIFTWLPDPLYLNNTDRVMLMAYAPALKEAIYMVGGAQRGAGSEMLRLPDVTWKNTVLEVYLSFVAEDRQQRSDSIYLGQVIMREENPE